MGSSRWVLGSVVSDCGARCGFDEGLAIRNPAVREKLADWYVKTVGLKYTKFRTMTALSRGQTPGPEASITKLVSASKLW